MDQLQAVRILDPRYGNGYPNENFLNQNCLLFKDPFMMSSMKHALPPSPSSTVNALCACPTTICTEHSRPVNTEEEEVLLRRSLHGDGDLCCSSYTDSSSSSTSLDDDRSDDDDDDDISATRRKRHIPSFRRYSRSICMKRSGILAGTIFIPSTETRAITKTSARTSSPHGRCPRPARRSTTISSITAARTAATTSINAKTEHDNDDRSCISDISCFDDLDADTKNRQQL